MSPSPDKRGSRKKATPKKQPARKPASRPAAPAGGRAGTLAERIDTAPYLVDPMTTVRVEIATLRAIRYATQDWGSLYAGFGVSGASIDSEIRVDAGRPVAGVFHSASNGLTATAGAQWNFASLSLRLEWWHTDMSGISVSLHWRD